eukprot:CAMPEP_0203758506 /NCGR_PEP_ID=MMETSP0098-20131031/11354_1 /ASSEMBLY_ACC=CAM_ASM_000208 /TAXON_ID=96639 /ORGANISM=" , Strain NY0313808BC1" /LENGTH=362 /DNA_ID=CAMNT_0050650983 /DNA_START=96 /DNA_END=1181 /DNA_ORIENTATION=+
MRRPNLTLNDVGADSLEESFAIENGQFVKGHVEISSNGVSRTDRSYSYQGLSSEDVNVIKVIGRGTSSQVSLVRHNNGLLMALKIINMYEKSKRNQIMEEIAALYDASCPSLVGFYGAFYQEGSISIALEYMDQGCLGTVLENYQRIPEPVLAAVTFQALWGLGYLRHAKRVHRDIKPQNILCNSNGEVKLTDFGISKELENSIGLCQTFVGTFKYMSPERIQSHPYSYASDIWSLGLVLMECAQGSYPYPECRTYIDMVQTILESPPPIPEKGTASAEFIDFATCCLKKTPKERVRADVLLSAPWLTKHGATSIETCQVIVRGWFASKKAPNVFNIGASSQQQENKVKTIESKDPSKPIKN